MVFRVFESQQHIKWRAIKDNLREEDLVLMQNKNLPPAKWALVRVQYFQSGKDGPVRVVRIKTTTSIFAQPITQLYKLFLSN